MTKSKVLSLLYKYQNLFNFLFNPNLFNFYYLIFLSFHYLIIELLTGKSNKSKMTELLKCENSFLILHII